MEISVEQKILSLALTEFLEKGIRSFTIGKLTSLGGVSSKTVYKIFGDKTNLLRLCLHRHYAFLHTQITRSLSAEENPIEALLAMTQEIVKQEFEVNPVFYQELNRYYPDLQDEMLGNYQDVRKLYTQTIRQGMDQGFIRKDIDEDLACISLQRLYSGITRDGIYDAYELPIRILIHNTLMPFFRGMCTPLGLKTLEQFELRNTDSKNH